MSKRFSFNFSNKKKLYNCSNKYIYIDNFEDSTAKLCIQYDEHNEWNK